MKCPYCDSELMDRIEPNQDCQFVISEMNINSHKRVRGFKVDMYGCPDCGGILLKSNFKLED